MINLPFYQSVDITYKMFSKYVTRNPDKGRNISHGQGPAPLLKWEYQRYVADVLACRNRVNKGCDVGKVVDIVCELTKKGTRKQAYQHVKKCILPKCTDLLKNKVVVAQKTTTNWLQITIRQQYCWHTTVNSAFNELIKQNQGLCRLSRKPF